MKSVRNFFSLFLIALLACLLVYSIRQWLNGRSPLGFLKKNEHRPESYTLAENAALKLDDVELLARLDNEFAKLTDAVVPSVVSIDTAGVHTQRAADVFGRIRTLSQRTQGQGSGVIVSKEGHIITNEHVISDQQQIKITLHDGKTYDASLIGVDARIDIAVLKINGGGTFQPLKLGDSSQVRVGQMVFAVGNPFGLSESVTQGIISAKDRSISDERSDLFQTDTAINPGNSGGPLVNIRGEIIGINVAIFSPDKENPGFQGVGFSIPANDVKETLAQIMERGRPVYGYLGVKLAEMNRNVAQILQYTGGQGVVIESVVENSPAQKAGLTTADVVLEYDGKVVQNRNQLLSLVQRSKIDSDVAIKIWRQGKNQILTAKIIENNPSLANQKSSGTNSTKIRDAEEVIKHYGVYARSFNVFEQTNGFRGALVNYVDPQGIAAKEIQINDIVLAINQNPIVNAQDFYYQFSASAAVQATQITLVRQGQKLNIVIPSLARKPLEGK